MYITLFMVFVMALHVSLLVWLETRNPGKLLEERDEETVFL
tara:strand:- start:657 stop:779 length:123 start_codon:yes stop_codon:yes gene_type:complete